MRIMKFYIQAKGPKQCRLGILTELANCSSDKILETPLCVLYTRAGNIPHLTWDTLQHLKGSTSIPILVSLPTTAHFANSVKEFGKGINSFVGLGEYISCVCIQDPATKTLSGYNAKNSVSVWNEHGRIKLDVEAFMKIQEAFKPCWYQALCDSDTPKDCANKRLQNSVDRSLSMLDQCIERHLCSEELKRSGIFGTVQGGFDERARKKSAIETALRPVSGFFIDGFHSNGPDVEKIDFQEVAPILEETIKLLPCDKPKIMNGCFTPFGIIQAIECGIDIFDSSYPYILTERGSALILPDFKSKSKAEALHVTTELNLTDKIYADDFSPLGKKCTCYTCQNFTRAYIHHLLTTSELLSYVLLMLHNLHVFLEFFAAVRLSLKEETFTQLKKTIFSLYQQ